MTDKQPLPQTSFRERLGIGGVEKSLAENEKSARNDISVAFQDLKKLMSMAKDMVQLSKKISQKMQDKSEDFTENETLALRKYLLSIGVDDPVTRDSYSTNKDYYRDLAFEINDVLAKARRDANEIIPLTDVYCMINRARGFNFVSPKDIISACSLLEDLPSTDVCLKRFQNGVYVVQSKSFNEQIVSEAILKAINESDSISATELAQIMHISPVLANENLLSCLQNGLIVIDSTVEGVKFYQNLFLDHC